ncbi:MAG: hypothetical protein WBD36_05590 [Bacteroidota bacterium]
MSFRKLLLFWILAQIGTSTGTAQTTDAGTDYGTLILTRLASAPFPHSQRASGHSYGGKAFPYEFHYRDSSVAIFIPKDFKKTASVDLVIHFHGWYNNIDTVLARYGFVRQFSESGKNAVLVVPEGPKNAPDSFGGKLEDENGLKVFVSEVLDTLFRRSVIATKVPGNIILSGHSGGYRVMSSILMRGGLTDHIREVYLFDALYGQTEKFAYWLDHTGGKLVNIYTDSGGTKAESENLMADLRGWNIPFLSDEENLVTPDELRTQRIIFLHTRLEHDEVLQRHGSFRTFLRASLLSDR